MNVRNAEVYFIVQDDLERAIERNELPRPMFTLINPAGPLPEAGDKLVYAEMSYRVLARTFSYEGDAVKIIVSLAL